MLYIILPVFNRAAITEAFAKQLILNTNKDWILVLVDDGSTDNTQQVVVNHISKDKLLILNGNGHLWWGGALHAAYMYVKDKLDDCDNILIINDDVVIGDDYIQNGLNLLENDKESIYISPCYSIENKNEIIDVGVLFDDAFCKFTVNKDLYSSINCCSTRGLFISSQNFMNSDGFDWANFPHYLSDYDFTLCLSKMGVRIKTSESIKLFSIQNATGMHRLPSILSPIQLLMALKSYKCSLNYHHWVRFIKKHTKNKCFFLISLVRFHMLLIKKTFHF